MEDELVETTDLEINLWSKRAAEVGSAHIVEDPCSTLLRGGTGNPEPTRETPDLQRAPDDFSFVPKTVRQKGR